MFRMLPSMGLSRRLAVWWSCLWRQLLFTLPLWALGLGLGTIWVFQRDRGAVSLDGICPDCTGCGCANLLCGLSAIDWLHGASRVYCAEGDCP